MARDKAARILNPEMALRKRFHEVAAMGGQSDRDAERDQGRRSRADDGGRAGAGPAVS